MVRGALNAEIGHCSRGCICSCERLGACCRLAGLRVEKLQPIGRYSNLFCQRNGSGIRQNCRYDRTRLVGSRCRRSGPVAGRAQRLGRNESQATWSLHLGSQSWWGISRHRPLDPLPCSESGEGDAERRRAQLICAGQNGALGRWFQRCAAGEDSNGEARVNPALGILPRP